MTLEKFSSFLEGAPNGAATLLGILSTAESLTDFLAEEMCNISPMPEIKPSKFVQYLKTTSFVIARNNEWCLNSDHRENLIFSDILSKELSTEVHLFLLARASPKLQRFSKSYPRYLSTVAGRAYHQAGSGDVTRAIRSYEEAALAPYSGEQWLASKLAEEQERLGVLPVDQTELLFLRAIALFREGHKSAAKPLIERVVNKDMPTMATAMALNILGNMSSTVDENNAESLFNRGILLSEQLGDQHGVSINKHNLGKMIGRNPKRFEEARGLLVDSISEGDFRGNIHHASVVRHSLGHLITKSNKIEFSSYAETELRSSIAGLESVGDRSGSAQAMHTLGILIGKSPERNDEAESLLRKSIEIGLLVGDDVGVEIRAYTMAKFLLKNMRQSQEAKSFLKTSRDISVSRRNLANVRKIDAVLRRYNLKLDEI